MNVVFDFGNVLLHWDPPALLSRLLPERANGDAAAADWVDRIFEGFDGDWGDFDRGRLEAGRLAGRIAARTGLSAADARRVIDAVPHELQPEPTMVGLLERVRAAGHRLWFLSNMPAGYADHLDRAHDWIGRFDGGLYSARVGLAKPDPALFELAARTFELDTRETLLVDDVQRNVDAALAAGWQAMLYTGTAACVATFERRGWLA